MLASEWRFRNALNSNAVYVRKRGQSTTCLSLPEEEPHQSDEPECVEKEGILLANPLQSSKSAFSRGRFLSFFAFKEGMLGTPISVRGGWPTVSGR
jgi:hypothetical protein